MKRRNFIKTMGMSVFISKLFISCSESPISSVSELEDKKQEYLIIEKDKITIYKPLTDIDKSVLENFLMQFDKNEDPNYSLEDLEKNLLLIKNHDKEFTGTLIDENGYFITVKHSLKSNLKDYQAITSSNQIYNIEKIIISSEFCDYDFVLGKINNETPLEFSNMLYSTKINIGDSVTYVPSPIHSSRTKVTGEIIKKKKHHRTSI